MLRLAPPLERLALVPRVLRDLLDEREVLPRALLRVLAFPRMLLVLLFPRIELCFERDLLAPLLFRALPERDFPLDLFDDIFARDLLRVDDLFLVEVVGIEYHSSVPEVLSTVCIVPKTRATL